MPPELPDIVQLAVPFFVLAMLIELLIGRWRQSARYEPLDTMASLVMGVGNLVEGILFGFVGYAILLWVYDHLAVIQLGFAPWVFVVGLVVDDVRYYWKHRAGHRIRFWWAAHVTHHSSQHYNLSTALRQTWTETLTLGVLFRIPLVLLGFHPVVLGFAGSISLVYQFWIHTEAIGRLPRWVEAIWNTPSHHRVHHATNPRYLDANYAGIWIVWDRLFGTFVVERADDAPRYGLVRNIGTFNPVRIALHEVVTMVQDALQPGIPARARMLYVFGPPGWSHDGSRRTVDAIKSAWAQSAPDEPRRNRHAAVTDP